MPLFYKFDVLDEAKHCTKARTKGLKAALDALADGLAFPLKKIFVMDGSTRSGHSNAFQYGFCSNKRIVLYDTLLEQMSTCITDTTCSYAARGYCHLFVTCVAPQGGTG